MKKFFYINLLISFILCITTIAGFSKSSLPFRPGSRGPVIEKFQADLNMLYFYQGAIDGIYGQMTEKAVKQFQEAAGIPIDGIMGFTTQNALKQALGHKESLSELKKTTHSPEVIYLQYLLYHFNYYSGKIDGVFGPITRAAVKDFQNDTGLTVNGIVDFKFWKLIHYFKENEIEPDNYVLKNKPILKKGDQGEQVKELQSLLNILGFLTNKVDGFFGLNTKLAVKLSQQFYNLHDDGIVEPSLWSVFNNYGKQEDYEHIYTYTVKFGDTLWDLSREWNISLESITRLNNLGNPRLLIAGQELKIPGIIKTKEIKIINWRTVHNIFKKNDILILTDVDTGLNFRVRRLGGVNHADVEPLTAQDTAVMKEIYGGQWSWERRAMVVHLDGKQIAGSINGYPHGSQSIYNNNFEGHICLHVYGSRLHVNGTRDQEHQNQVQKAASYTWPLGHP